MDEGKDDVYVAAGEKNVDGESFVTAANDDLKNNNKYLNHVSQCRFSYTGPSYTNIHKLTVSVTSMSRAWRETVVTKNLF